MAIVNSDNKFGTNRFIVSPNAGDGAFTSIQDAVDAANAAGGGAVLINQGNYTGNVSLKPQVFLYGLTVAKNSNIIILGTIDVTDVNGNTGMENVQVESQGSDNAVDISNNSGSFCNVFFNGCILNSALGSAIVSTGTALSSVSLSIVNTDVQGTVYGLDLVSYTQIQMQYSSGIAGTAVGRFGPSTQANIFFSICNAFGGQGFIINDPSVTLILLNCFGSFTNELVDFASAGTAVVVSCGFSCSSGSGNWASGAAGTLTFSSISVIGSSGIAPGITRVNAAFLPYSTAGNTGTAIRGSSGFDSSSFSITDGFVSLSGTGSMVRQTISSNQALAVNNAYYVTSGALSLSLPATSSVGDIVQVTLAGGTSYDITQIVGQQMRIGSVMSTIGAGGSATTTADGDSILLECTIANLEWTATSVIGNFTVV